MRVRAEMDGGACGFHTQADAISDDDQHLTFTIHTDCEKIGRLAAALADRQPLDAYQEIGQGAQGVLLATARETLTGCCAGCAVPVGLFKAMQVAAGLALPKDVSIRLTKQQR